MLEILINIGNLVGYFSGSGLNGVPCVGHGAVWKSGSITCGIIDEGLIRTENLTFRPTSRA